LEEEESIGLSSISERNQGVKEAKNANLLQIASKSEVRA
jgi:hypothetical protein